MLKAAIVSDTHIPSPRAKSLPGWLVSILEQSDVILHLGDFNTMEVVRQLEAFAPIYGVYGNNDDEEVVSYFPERKSIELEGIRIGLIHGHGKSRTTETRAWDAFASEQPDIIMFGHSHIPLDKIRDGIRLFNPGSPTDKRRQPQYSCGILKIDNGQFQLEHIYSKEK
ncbi:metallophosphoesterase family protein [Marinicrinis lubricantis]|uniref:Phosphoesterase n=1 Tax=Marinicrinis lubricantis TaxID=2086470 RepID=A0ABW1ILE4_9BACL